MKTLIGVLALLAGAPSPADEKTSIIHIIGDDVGYDDLGEKKNVASAHPEIVDRLKARVEKATLSFQNDRPLE